ncbi:deoxyribonuclease-2-beta isoform X2 [Peromyscus maniculatus bairdii]|uniref:deoxyribonuclease-2-beta isoform X2 n=1 Tax=Peromyscus maniculatus bairdii TaxID=230844 RepID=UPI001C2F026B|nr:deoxyribonuclease-2-beta isoform X2 [Peromyscus maniculatus bairdii]
MAANSPRTALALLFFALSWVLGTPEISCKKEDGGAVDWFIFYKLPKRPGSKDAASGLEYLYLDSTMRSWRKSQYLVNSSKSVLGRTLEQLYKVYTSKSNETAYLMYNDGVPKSTNYSRKYGHTKGLLVWNRIQGFWLIHSVPRFPPFPEDGYEYPSSGRRYGQSGICITFKYSQYEVIDIFTAWMAQQLKTDLLAETWQRKGHALPSNCSLPYHVYNIKAIKLYHRPYFSSYHDHSKWCVSTQGSKYRWTCIGDLNRDPRQAFRSGGFICTHNQEIYYAFHRLLVHYEPCD